MMTETNKPHKDCVYFFRLNGCGHCEALKPIWKKVRKIIKDSKLPVKFIEVESADISKLDNYTKKMLKTDQIMGYPDVRILKKNGGTSTFQANRTVPELVNWIKSNTSKMSTTKKRRGKHTRQNRRRTHRRNI